MANDLDYKLKLGYDATELEKGHKDAVKKMAKVQETLTKLYRTELTLLKKGTSERQSQLAVMQQQLRLQQKINSLQGKTTQPATAARPQPRRQSKRDPNSDPGISSRARITWEERLSRGFAKDYSTSITDPKILKDVQVLQSRLGSLKKELAGTNSFRSLEKIRLNYAQVQKEIAEAVRLQKQLNRDLQRGNQVGKKFASTAKSFALHFASAYAAVGAAGNIYRTGKELDSMRASLLAASGSAVAAEQDFKYLTSTSQELGKELTTLVDGYNKVSIAGRMAGYTTEENKNIFMASAELSTAYGLSKEKTALINLAFSQMINKQKVSMEELSRQLGEHIPGAVTMAAKSMGYGADSVGEFIKRVEDGSLATNDFIHKFVTFARQDIRTSGALAAGKKKLTSEQQRLTASYQELIDSVFQGGGAESLSGMFRTLNVILRNNWEEIKAVISVSIELTSSFIQLGASLGKVAIGALDVFGKLVSLGTARNGVSYLVGIFYDLVAVIYKASAGVQFLGDLLKGDFKDAMKYLRGAEMAVIQGEQTAFDRLTAPILQARQKAEASAPVKIDKIEYNSYNSDPKQSMIEFDRYLENNLSNLLAYKR